MSLKFLLFWISIEFIPEFESRIEHCLTTTTWQSRKIHSQASMIISAQFNPKTQNASYSLLVLWPGKKNIHNNNNNKHRLYVFNHLSFSFESFLCFAFFLLKNDNPKFNNIETFLVGWFIQMQIQNLNVFFSLSLFQNLFFTVIACLFGEWMVFFSQLQKKIKKDIF